MLYLNLVVVNDTGEVDTLVPFSKETVICFELLGLPRSQVDAKMASAFNE
jgi:hypothetical protein